MRIYELIDNKTRKALCAIQHQGRPIKKKSRVQERLSERDLKELMGVNRDKYHRVNGKVIFMGPSPGGTAMRGSRLARLARFYFKKITSELRNRG